MASTKKVLHLIITHSYFVDFIAELAGGNYKSEYIYIYIYAGYCAITAVAH